MTPLTTTVSAAAVDAVGDGGELGGVEHHAIGPGTGFRQGGDAPADGEVRATVAESLDRADEVVAGDEWERRLVVVVAAAHLLLGERDAGRLDAHHRLVRARVGQLAAGDLESLRLHGPGEHDLGGVHGTSPLSRIVGSDCYSI